VKIFERVDNGEIVEGDTLRFDKFRVTIEADDVSAIKILSTLYNTLSGKASYADVERILVATMWWHVTLATLLTGQDDAGLHTGKG